MFLAKELDFETQSSYSISINVTDDDNFTSYQNLLISVVNVVENNAPQNIFLTNSIIPENSGANYTIGEFIIIDESFDNHTFVINNSNFKIDGNELLSKS